jgi:DMSO/TMAO reductase YedYZ molybdopterin-dependent catalytic subunit
MKSMDRMGRGLFLATVFGGLSSLWWGKRAWDSVSSATSGLPLLPGGGWRIYTIAGSIPAFEPTTWRLEVGGLVEKPLSLDYGSLRALPSARQISDFHCVTGWSVNDVHWHGVRLKDLFAEARPLPEAHGVRFVSSEVPYDDYLTMRQALLPDVMLAYDMDRAPLSSGHGAPLRLVVPRMYGYKGVKWLSRIELVPKAEPGYWEERGYDSDAWVGRSNGLSS